jgi:hypothetical protein
MGRVLALITAIVLCSPLPGAAQGGPATLENAAKALGADRVKTLRYSASGVSFAMGQSPVPGAAVITHETTRAFFEGVLAAPATMTPDRQQNARKKGNTHADGMLMVYLPKERLLVQTDAYTPAPPNAPAMVNPLSVNLADNIARLGLGVDRLLPLHGRIVPLVELHKAIGRSN